MFHGEDDPHPQEVPKSIEEFDIPEADGEQFNDVFAEELKDRYIGVKVLLPQHGNLQEAQVLSRKRSSDGKMLIGTENANPLLDSRV